MSERTKETDNGRDFWQYPDGTSQWCDNGQFRTGPTISPIARDPRGMLAKRNAKSEQDARDAIDEAAIAAGKLERHQYGTGEGWKSLVQHVAETLLKSSNVRGQAEALRILAVVAGYASRDAASKTPVHVDRVNIVGTELLLEVVQAIEGLHGRRNAHVIEAPTEPSV